MEEGYVVVVTGATGYIAAHIIQQLQQAGYHVRGTTRRLPDAAILANRDKIKNNVDNLTGSELAVKQKQLEVAEKDEKYLEYLYGLCPDALHKVELVQADLLQPESWHSAIKGAKYVIHVASPFILESRKETEVITPAREGTLNVLKACAASRTVKRVVVTGSLLAVDDGHISGHYTEDNWSSGVDGIAYGNGKQIAELAAWDYVSQLTADGYVAGEYTEDDWACGDSQVMYGNSKQIAERAAWDYVSQLTGEDKFEMVVLNPGFVFGPVINTHPGASIKLVQQIMQHELPAIPNIQFHCCDVRDVATCHVNALTAPDAAGKRHIVSSGEPIPFPHLVNILNEEFKPQGYRLTTYTLPYPILWLASFFDRSLIDSVKRSGIEQTFSITRCQTVRYRAVLQHYSSKYVMIDLSLTVSNGPVSSRPSALLASLIDSVKRSGIEQTFSIARMLDVLRVKPRPIKQTMLDMAYSLIERGFLPKKPGYRGPPNGGN